MWLSPLACFLIYSLLAHHSPLVSLTLNAGELCAWLTIIWVLSPSPPSLSEIIFSISRGSVLLCFSMNYSHKSLKRGINRFTQDARIHLLFPVVLPSTASSSFFLTWDISHHILRCLTKRTLLIQCVILLESHLYSHLKVLPVGRAHLPERHQEEAPSRYAFRILKKKE